MKHVISICFLLCCFSILFSCKKSNTSSSPTCLITKIHSTDTLSDSVYILSYDASNRINKVIGLGISPDTLITSYNNNYILCKMSGQSLTPTNYVYTLNNQNLVSKLAFINNGINDDSIYYIYNSASQLVKSYDSTYQTSTVYSWQNGNMQYDGNTYYQYGAQKNTLVGDMFWYSYTLNYGIDSKYFGMYCTNLISSFNSGNNISFAYTFDTKGNISSFIINGANPKPDTIRYDYECK